VPQGVPEENGHRRKDAREERRSAGKRGTEVVARLERTGARTGEGAQIGADQFGRRLRFLTKFVVFIFFFFILCRVLSGIYFFFRLKFVFL